MSEKSREKEREKMTQEMITEIQKGLGQMGLYVEEKKILKEIELTEVSIVELGKVIKEFLAPFQTPEFINTLATCEAVSILQLTKILNAVMVIQEYGTTALLNATKLKLAVEADKKIIAFNKDIITP